VLHCVSALYHDRDTVDQARWRQKITAQRAPRLGLALGPESARAGPGANNALFYAQTITKLKKQNDCFNVHRWQVWNPSTLCLMLYSLRFWFLSKKNYHCSQRNCLFTRCFFFRICSLPTASSKGAARGGWRGSSPPLAIRILMFIS